jgi:hypothetical protein
LSIAGLNMTFDVERWMVSSGKMYAAVCSTYRTVLEMVQFRRSELVHHTFLQWCGSPATKTDMSKKAFFVEETICSIITLQSKIRLGILDIREQIFR